MVVAKSTIILDVCRQIFIPSLLEIFSFQQVKPCDDETNMEELERNVRSIELDGLLWGACMSHILP